jgi:hypothetical protein
MVNGVLVERTVSDVLPTLKTNSDGLKQVLEELLKSYKSKQAEMDSWKVCPLAVLGISFHIVKRIADLLLNRKRITFKLYNHKIMIYE